MRRALAALAAVVIVAAIATDAEGARTAGPAALKRRPVGHLNVRLPGPGQSRVELLTLTLAVSRGEIGSLLLRTLNESQLSSGVRAFGAVLPSSSDKRTATFKIFIGINNLDPDPAREAQQASGATDLDIVVFNLVGPSLAEAKLQTTYYKLTELSIVPDCETIVRLGNKADVAYAHGDKSSIRLYKLANEPGSAAEAILDHVAYNMCSAYGLPSLLNLATDPSEVA